MPEVLKVFHLANQDGVAEVQIGRRGIEADLDGEWTTLRELVAQLAGADHIHAALRQVRQLLVNRERGHRR